MLNNFHMRYKQTVAPILMPVDVGDIKLHTRVDHTAEDTLLSAYISAATKFAEHVTSRAFITQQYDLFLDKFPDEKVINLPLAPVQSIDTVSYVDSNGITQTLPSRTYDVDLVDDGRVIPSHNYSWPQTREQLNAVKISITVGYGTPSDVPDDIKHAIRLLVAHFYENREATTMHKVEQAPLAVQSLLNNYRWRF